MKNLYLKNKGKVYPSPSTDSALSLLNLLPAAILALASILSAEDREVLAYLITTNPSSVIEDRKKKCKKPTHSSLHSSHVLSHRVPLFECGCFECYTSYWFRWDSSPNRELIHQVVEAFEDHLTRGERAKSGGGGGGGRGKKREKSKVFDEIPKKMKLKNSSSNSNSAEIVKPQPQPQPQIQMEVVAPVVTEEEKVEEEEAEKVVVGMGGGCYSHKGLARKVLPDVMGLFNSRIWNLWSNNI